MKRKNELRRFFFDNYKDRGAYASTAKEAGRSVSFHFVLGLASFSRVDFAQIDLIHFGIDRSSCRLVP